MPTADTSHYATLGLDHRCTGAQIRAAYRVLAMQHHPDLNRGSPGAVARTQQLNAAYEILGDPGRRRAYDQSQPTGGSHNLSAAVAKPHRNVSQEVHMRPEEFLRGTSLEVRVNDPANPGGPEVYPLTIPPETAPGTRFRVPRAAPFEAGIVTVKVKARPDSRFKVRGSDLRCDLRIRAQRAEQGGSESVRGATGSFLRVQIPPRVARGEFVRIPGEGLPKPRGGRGDLLVRILYTPGVQIRRASPH